jgi:hypothetical protein
MRESYEDCPGPEVVMEVFSKILDAENPNPSYADTLESKIMITAKNLLPEKMFDSAIRSKVAKG